MTTEKQFICVCGKTFTNSQSFNGHKSGCKEHHLVKYGTAETLADMRRARNSKSATTRSNRSKDEQIVKVAKWVSEKHCCKKCGKVMLEKYGSGLFCSRSCANSRERSDELKQRVSDTLKTFAKANGPDYYRRANGSYNAIAHERSLQKYLSNPSYCKVCNNVIPYKYRRRKTCSEDCYSEWIKTTGGLRRGSGTGKHGWYKGYYCDSSYELAYVIYNLDHNIQFERNKKYYTYLDINSKVHKYYPDFIENNILVEIKGYWTENVQRKIDAVDDLPIKLLMKKDIQYMIDYVKLTYNCTDITILYDS